jgi:hypothetical protein
MTSTAKATRADPLSSLGPTSKIASWHQRPMNERTQPTRQVSLK